MSVLILLEWALSVPQIKKKNVFLYGTLYKDTVCA